MKAIEILMSWRYLRARRQEGFVSVITWFSLVGIALGVATLIIVMSVMNGFRAELIGRILGLNGHINLRGPERVIEDYQPLAERLETLPGIVNAAPFVEGQVMMTSRGQARGGIVRGMSIEDMQQKSLLWDQLVSHDPVTNLAKGEIILGHRLARELGVGIGDDIQLVSPQSNVTAFGNIPRIKKMTVRALFNVGMHEYDSGFAFMGLEDAQIYFRLKGKVQSVEIMTEDVLLIDDIRRQIRQWDDGIWRAYDWRNLNAGFVNALQVERNVMFLILTLIIVVAAFNIISSLIMLVQDKGREIAILRTMGMQRGAIMRIFFMAGAYIGVVGTGSGFVLGLAFCLNIESIRRFIESLTGSELFPSEIYFLSNLPAKVDNAEVVMVVLMGLGLSFLATLYPSWKAARTEPAEALRYE